MSGYQVEVINAATLPQVAGDMYMDPTYVERVKDMMAKDLFVLFAVKEGGQYVGRCTLWLAPSDERELREEVPGVPQINALEVHVARRHRGIGTLLITTLENEARRRGHKMICIGVEPDNELARKMYEKLGYTYRKILGHDTHSFSWEETLADGTAHKLYGESMLMTKEI